MDSRINLKLKKQKRHTICTRKFKIKKKTKNHASAPVANVSQVSETSDGSSDEECEDDWEDEGKQGELDDTESDSEIEEMKDKLNELLSYKSKESYDEMHASILDATIQAMQQGLRIQRKKLIIKGIRNLTHPSRKRINKHFKAWLEENSEFKFNVENERLFRTHPNQPFIRVLKQYLTHDAFERIHRLHKHSSWLQARFWVMYETARKYIDNNKDLIKLKAIEKKKEDAVEDPDPRQNDKDSDEDSVYGRWANSQEVEQAISEMQSTFESLVATNFIFFSFCE